MKKLLTSIIILLAIVAKAQTLHFHQLTVKDGLPHNSIITLAQDAKGNIWVATHGGLLKYDGQQFYKLPFEELPDKRVDRINQALDGTMWVQCFERHQLVSRYDTISHHFVTYNVSDLSDSVRQQAVQPLNRTFSDPRSSRVWTIEKRQLWQIDTLHADSKFAYTEQTGREAGLKDEVFYSIVLDDDGILWVGSANNGLFFADTRQSYYHRLVCQPAPTVRATYIDSKDNLWIAISDQHLLIKGKGSSETARIDYPMTDSVEGRRIRAILEDSKKRIWLGTHDGLYIKEVSATAFRRVALSTKPIAVFSLCNDDNKRLWIGTNCGLYSLLLEERQPQAQFVDSTVTSINHIATDKKGLWMSTETGLYFRADGQTEQWSKMPTHAIITDGRGQTWIGTDDGLMMITEQGVKPISTVADGHTVKDLLCWRDFLWCSYEQGLCCVNIYTLQSATLHTEHNEYLDGSACIDTRTGTLYFGGTEGIDCFSADSLDEQLRSGLPKLWLEEISEELSGKSEESGSPVWPYAVLLLVIGSAAVAGSYFFRKKNQVDQFLDGPSGKAERLDSILNHESVPLIQKEPSPFIIKATAIAEAHIADADFTAEQMAQELAMSRTKLFLLMKKETGKAVMEFVRDIRLDYAARQLEAGTPVGEIYMACGFSDPSSFRRSFVKKFGINPSQYREKRRQ